MTLLATLPDIHAGTGPLMADTALPANSFIASTAEDALLLRRFLHRRDKDAFSQMVRRHGPMVLQTCQRVVGQACDADDAFQAVFMVLVRRAASIQPPEMLGPWLHGVAYRCSLALKQKLNRQKHREQVLLESHPVEAKPVESMDWLPYLDQEIERLPEIYRQPVVLCELEGRGRQEAAKILGVAEGTLSSRLAQARKRLAQRLGKRGLLSVAVLSSWAAMNSSASAALPELLVESTTQLGMNLLEQQAALAVSPVVAELTQGAIRTMFIQKCKFLAMLAVGFGCLSYGCWFLGGLGAMEPEPRLAAIFQPQGQAAGQSSADGSPNKSKGSGQQSSSASANSDKPGQTASVSAGSGANNESTTTLETIKGSGNVVTETRAVAGYNKLQLQNAGKILIKQTGAEKLTIKTDDNLLPLLVTEVEGAMLVLKNKTQANLKPTKDIDYIIEVKDMGKLEINGAGTIQLQDYNGKQLEVNIRGSATVRLEGQAINLKLMLAGSGNINGEKMSAQSANISIPGSGSVVVNARETLNVSIQGAGSIQYLGDPQVKKSITGAGSVKKLTPKKGDE